MHLAIPVHRLLANAARRLELGVETTRQLLDRLLERLRDGGEVLLVGGDQSGLGFVGEVVREVEGTSVQPVRSCFEVHVVGFHFRRLWAGSAILRHHPGLAASPPLGYKLRVEGSGFPPFHPSFI